MSASFDQLVHVMERLRGEGGCPWDREQTPDSLKPFLLEEAYEVLEAIDQKDRSNLSAELGDLLFQVLFHAQIAKENGAFDIETVVQGCIDKMTRRHPHVFGEGEKGQTADAVIKRWEELKQAEAKEAGIQKSVLAGLPKTLPALLRAQQVQSKVSRVGFDWKTPEAAFPKIEEELKEVKEAMEKGDIEALESELGDLLFSIVNVARLLKVNGEEALRKMIIRFTERFQKIELAAGERGVEALSLDEMNHLWEEAKKP